MEDGRKGIKVTGNIKVPRRNYPGLNLGSATSWLTLVMHYFIFLSLGVLVPKMGTMLMAPTCYEDQMS